jgi:hypothetical protein
MNALRHFRNWTTLALFVVLLAPVGVVQGQTSAHMTVTLTGQTLTAGFNNNVTITVTNTYTSYSIYPSGTIYDVGLTVSVPAPLAMVGDNQWHFDQMKLKQSVSISFLVYAPTSAIGTSCVGSVTLTYRALGDISYTQESHSIGFSVQGWIKLVLYGIQVTPSSTTSGGNATVSGNLLNSGNLAAYNANVTVQSEALTPGAATSVFLGEIDPNIPRPFSLLVTYKKNLTEGRYSLIIAVSAIDTNRPASPYSIQSTAPIQITKPVVQTRTQTRQVGGVVGIIFEVLRFLYGVFFGFWSMVTRVYANYSWSAATIAFILVVHRGR